MLYLESMPIAVTRKLIKLTYLSPRGKEMQTILFPPLDDIQNGIYMHQIGDIERDADPLMQGLLLSGKTIELRMSQIVSFDAVGGQSNG